MALTRHARIALGDLDAILLAAGTPTDTKVLVVERSWDEPMHGWTQAETDGSVTIRLQVSSEDRPATTAATLAHEAVHAAGHWSHNSAFRRCFIDLLHSVYPESGGLWDRLDRDRRVSVLDRIAEVGIAWAWYRRGTLRTLPAAWSCFGSIIDLSAA